MANTTSNGSWNKPSFDATCSHYPLGFLKFYIINKEMAEWLNADGRYRMFECHESDPIYLEIVLKYKLIHQGTGIDN